MKKILLGSFVVIGVFSGLFAAFTPEGKATLNQLLYYYPCSSPVEYSIGSVDARFNITRAQVLADLKQAAAIWNMAEGKTLLVYNPQGQLLVNMVYDERQSLDTSISSLEQSVSQDRSNLQPEIAQYKQLSSDFETKLQNLNQQIEYWNNRGGAPPDEFAKLTEEQKQLQEEADKLNTLAKNLNQSSNNYNFKVGQLNSTINSFNQTLAQKPEEGVFDPSRNEIDIYFDNSNRELIHTMAHEMGHALGLNHNSGQTSIMNPRTNESTTASLQDIQAIQLQCQRESRWEIFISRLQNIARLLSSQVAK